MHIDPMIPGIAIVAPTAKETVQSSLVVLAEDDKHIRQLLCNILVEQQGHTVITCERPEACWRFVSSCQHSIACLITEVRFARYTTIDGVGLVERVRAQLPSLPIVALYGPLDSNIVKTLDRLNARAIKKPFPIAAILDAMQNAVPSPLGA